MSLSEQAELIYLQEKLKDARSYETIGAVMIFLGILVVGLGCFLSNSVLLIFGVVVISIGVAYSGYYGFQRFKLMEQLKKMSTLTSTCPKCGKEMPKGNFTFCPFCGSSLERK